MVLANMDGTGEEVALSSRVELGLVELVAAGLQHEVGLHLHVGGLVRGFGCVN